MRYYSPLRYPGGKGRLADYIRLLLEKNCIEGGTYVEPFAGGAAVALALLLKGAVSRIIINDLSRPIYSFWFSVLNETKALLKLIEETEVTITEWRRQKQVQLNPDSFSTLELGFSTFFLNRTNRSGILSAGVIGGQQQLGKWKLDARYNKDILIARIKRIAAVRDKIELYCCDVFQFINIIVPSLDSKTLIYFDPPYFSKGDTLYDNYFEAEDHRRLAAVIKKMLKSLGSSAMTMSRKLLGFIKVMN